VPVFVICNFERWPSTAYLKHVHLDELHLVAVHVFCRHLLDDQVAYVDIRYVSRAVVVHLFAQLRVAAAYHQNRVIDFDIFTQNIVNVFVFAIPGQ
jgi:hypothetical protein